MAFSAAKTAMAGSKRAKRDQVFVFLSDGEPSTLDEGRQAMAHDFMKGEGVPRTLTVFFSMRKDGPPP